MGSACARIAAVICLTAALPGLGQDAPHHAFFDTDANTGGYVGAGLGVSNLSVDAGALAHSTSLVTEGRPLGFQLVGGYRPAPVWSAELGYLDLGRVSAGRTYAQTEGFVLSGLAYLPTPFVNLYGRLGFMDWRSYGRCSCEPDVSHLTLLHRSGLNGIYGIGGITNGRGNLNFRLEWERVSISDSRGADLVSLGAIWSFFLERRSRFSARG